MSEVESGEGWYDALGGYHYLDKWGREWCRPPGVPVGFEHLMPGYDPWEIPAQEEESK